MVFCQALEKVEMTAHTSQELRLLEFCSKCKILFDECVHQQFLKKYGLADLWTLKYYFTRAMFINAIVMNCMILVRPLPASVE